MTDKPDPKQNIAFNTHPEYNEKIDDWMKFRRVMSGGQEFKDAYLEQRVGESDPDFAKRKRITPIPAYAKSAVKKVRDAIYQRLDAIRRTGGSDKYVKAIGGKIGGVDQKGSTIEYFMGHHVLPELLSMGKVGVFVDSPLLLEERRTIRDNKNLHPYMYTYRAEDIRNWEFYTKDEALQFRKLLLRVRTENFDPRYNLVYDTTEQYRLFEVDEDGTVWVRFFNRKGDPTDVFGHRTDGQSYVMEVDQIPFVLLELENSLLEDIADHQIALLNMESRDVNFCLRANTITYIEQYDPAFEMIHNQRANTLDLNGEESVDNSGAVTTNGDPDNPEEIVFGDMDGRRYAKNLDKPGFIAPPSDPMQISMEKQAQLKDDIDRTLDLATLNTRSRYASAESKGFDERGLESGLAAIGLVLENAERRIGVIWNDYEGGPEISVKYPERYSLRSDEERRKDAKSLIDVRDEIPSTTFRNITSCEIAEILLGGKVDESVLSTIFDEIKSSKYPTANAEAIRTDVEIGLLSRETGSLARGWPSGEAAKAEKEREKRDAATAMAQGVNLGARGITDDPEAAREEKNESQNPENNPDGIKKVRGAGKNGSVRDDSRG